MLRSNVVDVRERGYAVFASWSSVHYCWDCIAIQGTLITRTFNRALMFFLISYDLWWHSGDFESSVYCLSSWSGYRICCSLVVVTFCLYYEYPSFHWFKWKMIMLCKWMITIFWTKKLTSSDLVKMVARVEYENFLHCFLRYSRCRSYISIA